MQGLKEFMNEASGDFAGWIAGYNGKQIEIKKDEAKDLWGAKQIAIAKLKVPKSKQGLLWVKPAVEESIKEDGEELNESLGKTKMDAIQAFRAFDEGFKRLVGAMEDDSTDVFVDNVGKGYPFKEDFVELYHGKVKKWIQNSLSNITKSKEDYDS